METAKVDIRKLQMLNDRINQCLDALNQVRFSVHGLGHSAPGNPASFNQASFNPMPWGWTSPYGQQDPRNISQDPRFFSPGAAGLSHTPYTPINPYLPYGQGVTPFGAPQAAWNPGLSHSGPDLEGIRPFAVDPLLAVRVAQTFPFAQLPVSPVTPIP